VNTDNGLESTVLDGEIRSWHVSLFGPDNDEIVVNGHAELLLHMQTVKPRKGRINCVMLDMAEVDRERGIEVSNYQERAVLLGCRMNITC
jgi:hypothetical protein